MSRLTWAGHVERMRHENWQREQMLRKWMEKEARKTEIAMGDCINNDPERVRQEWRKRATDKRNWRLLIEPVVRRKNTTTETEIMVNSPVSAVMPRKVQQNAILP